jgi:predicted DNA-binding transcriptional regulator AlpA
MKTDKVEYNTSYPVRFVQTQKFEELTGITKLAVYAYVKKGQWQEGVHYVKKGRSMFIDLFEVDKWIGAQEKRRKLRRRGRNNRSNQFDLAKK